MKTASTSSCSSAIFIVIVSVAAQSLAQQLNTGPVEQAAFRQASSEISGRRVRFERRLAQVGDAVEQEINLQMRMTTSIRQANELTGQHRNTVTSDQRRIVTT